MVHPDELSQDQKRFLMQHYQLDVDRPRQYRRGDRTIYIVRPWLGIFLALGLFWETPSDPFYFPSGPAEIVAWGLVTIMLLFCIAQVIRTSADISLSPEESENAKDRWPVLFRDMIRKRARYVRCDYQASVIGVGIIALLTGRAVLAIAWAVAILSWLALLKWFDHLVRSELRKIVAAARTQSP